MREERAKDCDILQLFANTLFASAENVIHRILISILFSLYPITTSLMPEPSSIGRDGSLLAGEFRY